MTEIRKDNGETTRSDHEVGERMRAMAVLRQENVDLLLLIRKKEQALCLVKVL